MIELRMAHFLKSGHASSSKYVCMKVKNEQQHQQNGFLSRLEISAFRQECECGRLAVSRDCWVESIGVDNRRFGKASNSR